MKGNDTSELFFNDVRVPASNLLGAEGKGFYVLMRELAWERMIIAIRAVAISEEAIEATADYARGRHAFGKPILDMQYNRFKPPGRKAQVTIHKNGRTAGGERGCEYE